jgi:hypothetical protein
MLKPEQIDHIARQVAQQHLAALGVQDVQSEPTIDSDGNEALRITITIHSADKASESGDALLDTLSEISLRLQEEGDPRFPIIDYVTEEELGRVGDSES